MNAQIDVIYTDIDKAFDTVNHSLLLNKLQHLGIHSALLAWIQSYLSDRKQFVKLSGLISKPINVCSGVSQGSHLGPLLFILFINYIPNILSNSNCLMFADDLKIFQTVQSHQDELNLSICFHHGANTIDYFQILLNVR